MFGVDSVNPPTLPSPGMFISGSVNDRPFHLSMIQLIALRKASLMPFHMPDAAFLIFFGRPLTKSTTQLNLSRTQFTAPVTQSRTVSKTPFQKPKYCLTLSHNHFTAPAARSNCRLMMFSHHHVTTAATTSNAFLMPSQAGLIAFSHNHFAASPTALKAASTMLRNVSDFL